MLNYCGSYSLSNGYVVVGVTIVIKSYDQKQVREKRVSLPSLPLSLSKDRTATKQRWNLEAKADIEAMNHHPRDDTNQIGLGSPHQSTIKKMSYI